MFAIRAGREYAMEEDFFKAARKIKETKKLESKLDYSKVWINIINNNYKILYSYALILRLDFCKLLYMCTFILII